MYLGFTDGLMYLYSAIADALLSLVIWSHLVTDTVSGFG